MSRDRKTCRCEGGFRLIEMVGGLDGSSASWRASSRPGWRGTSRRGGSLLRSSTASVWPGPFICMPCRLGVIDSRPSSLRIIAPCTEDGGERVDPGWTLGSECKSKIDPAIFAGGFDPAVWAQRQPMSTQPVDDLSRRRIFRFVRGQSTPQSPGSQARGTSFARRKCCSPLPGEGCFRLERGSAPQGEPPFRGESKHPLPIGAGSEG